MTEQVCYGGHVPQKLIFELILPDTIGHFLQKPFLEDDLMDLEGICSFPLFKL